MTSKDTRRWDNRCAYYQCGEEPTHVQFGERVKGMHAERTLSGIAWTICDKHAATVPAARRCKLPAVEL